MKRILSLTIIFCLLLCGCYAEKPTRRITITATVFPEYDFARAIAGSKAEITLLIPAGADAHSFEPSLSDVAKIRSSDVFIYIGGESDLWLGKVLSGIDKSKTAVIRLSDHICLIGEHSGDEHAHSHPHSHSAQYDEHIWTSPENARIMIEQICRVLSEKYPEFATEFKANAAAYAAEINQADQKTREIIESSETKKIVVADRFPYKYLTEYYGISATAAFGGCQADTDADLATVIRLTNAVEENNLTAVFKNELSSGSVAKTVAERTGAEVLELHSMQNISPSDFNSGVRYVDIMYRNATALNRALKGK